MTLPVTYDPEHHGVSKWQLFSSLVNRHEITISQRVRPVSGVVNSIEIADGVDHVWNAYTIRFAGSNEDVFVRTID